MGRPPNTANKHSAAGMRRAGMTVEQIAASQGRSPRSVKRDLSEVLPMTDTATGADEGNITYQTKRANLLLKVEQAKKTKAHNDLVAGRTVWKENVNQLILRHAERFNTALRQLRLIDQTHGTSAASTLHECYEGFGDEVETILNRKP